ncbi:MAG: hypothetical protein CMI60_02675 [Parvibaculum sp.]|jgi:hypothetical protein|nr:hypothetical protein [Parvibaculum sp.]|tara:strand:+ start:528 stop:854 length:327 start_codon:yes stop_codon:yes gene_type:complete
MIVRRVKPLSVFVLLVAALGLSACAFERDPQLLQDPLYKAGHADGCQSAHTEVSGFDETIQRNKALYETEAAYRTGWGDGYGSCGRGRSQFDDRSILNEGNATSGIDY